MLVQNTVTYVSSLPRRYKHRVFAKLFVLDVTNSQLLLSGLYPGTSVDIITAAPPPWRSRSSVRVPLQLTRQFFDSGFTHTVASYESGGTAGGKGEERGKEGVLGEKGLCPMDSPEDITMEDALPDQVKIMTQSPLASANFLLQLE